jgi:hypothetical protein
VHGLAPIREAPHGFLALKLPIRLERNGVLVAGIVATIHHGQWDLYVYLLAQPEPRSSAELHDPHAFEVAP